MIFHSFFNRIKKDLSEIDSSMVAAFSEEWNIFFQRMQHRYRNIKNQVPNSFAEIQQIVYEDYAHFLHFEYKFKPNTLKQEVSYGMEYRDFLRLEFLSLGHKIEELETACDPNRVSVLSQWFIYLYGKDQYLVTALGEEALLYRNRMQVILGQKEKCQDLVDHAMQYFSRGHGEINFERFFQSEVYIARKILQLIYTKVDAKSEPYRQIKARLRTMAQRIIASVQQYRENLLRDHLAREIELKKEISKQQKELEAKHRAMTRNLEMARQVQAGFLPQQLPLNPNLQVASLFLPMEHVAGDFFDWVNLPDNCTGFAVFDVSGHGAAAALLSSFVKIIFDQATRKNLSTSHTLNYINKALVGRTNDFFLTMFYCIYDPNLNVLHYSNGGHTYPYLIKSDKVLRLRTGGRMLGLFEEANIGESIIPIDKGDRLVLFTDGLVESINETEEDFGEERLEKILLNFRQKTVQETCDHIHKNLVAFAGSKGFDDDITLVLIDFLA